LFRIPWGSWREVNRPTDIVKKNEHTNEHTLSTVEHTLTMTLGSVNLTIMQDYF